MMGRARKLHDQLDPCTLHGAIKLRAAERNITLGSLAAMAGLRPDSLRARLSISRGKRALQPWQVTKIAEALDMPPADLHRLAAQHEGWQV